MGISGCFMLFGLIGFIRFIRFNSSFNPTQYVGEARPAGVLGD